MIRTRKWSDLWGIPGGKIKWGESSIDALRREIKEETNLDVTGIRFVLAQDCIRSKEFYREAHFILLNYTCRCAGAPRVTLNEEAVEFRWVAPARALKLPLNSPTRTLLAAVRRNRKIRTRRKEMNSMSRITIVDLEVSYCVGLTDEERAQPQRLLITVDLDYDFASACIERPDRKDHQLPDPRRPGAEIRTGTELEADRETRGKPRGHDPRRIQAPGRRWWR